jgi:hypothetical protein
MKKASRSLQIVRFSAIAVTFALAAFVYFGISSDYRKVGANVTGPPPSQTSAPDEGNCTACHSDFPVNSGDGNVLIEGVPAVYTPGQEIAITVTVNQSDGVIFGFQLTAVDELGQAAGTFTLPVEKPARTQIVEGIVGTNPRFYVEHTVQGTAPTEFGTNSWTFTWTAPEEDAGIISFYAAGNAANSDGDTIGDRIYITDVSTSTNASGTTPFDFDGDNKTDFSIFRPAPGEWWYLRSSDGGNNAFQFGMSSDTLVPADYTGDGRTDIAFWRESTGEWFVLRSEDSSFFSFPFGSNGDIPAPGDFDGDGMADAAIFRPSTGTWFVLNSSGGTTITPFGIAEDKPVVGDYDGDGMDDLAIFRPSSAQWWLNRSTDGVVVYQFGASGDRTVQGDYTGDGKTDVAFFRPTTGEWFVIRSEDDTFFGFPFGVNGDIPSPGDYDGDGVFDAAVFRPSTTTWFVNGSTSGTQIVGFGLSGDTPLPSVYSVP